MLLILPISDGPNQSPGQQRQPDQANGVQALVVKIHADKVRRDQREQRQHGQNAWIFSHVEGSREEYLHHAHQQTWHRAASQELGERNGVSDYNWVHQRHRKSEHHARVITDLQSWDSHDLLLNDQAISPQQACEDVKKPEKHSQSYIGHKVVMELGMSRIVRIYLGHYVLSIDCDHYSQAARQNTRDLHRVYLGAIQPIIAQKREDRPTDVENIDDRQRHNEMHESVSNLINQHDSIP